MTNPDVVLASEQMTPRQLVAKLSTIGVSAVVTVADNTATGERIEGVSMNFTELADALTGGKYGFPEPLVPLIRAAAAGTLPKGPTTVKDAYVPDLAYCVMGWGSGALLATGSDKDLYLSFLWEARKVLGN